MMALGEARRDETTAALRVRLPSARRACAPHVREGGGRRRRTARKRGDSCAVHVSRAPHVGWDGMGWKVGWLVRLEARAATATRRPPRAWRQIDERTQPASQARGLMGCAC
jgi:hypothetical protein